MMDGATTGSVLAGPHSSLDLQRKSLELTHRRSPYRRKSFPKIKPSSVPAIACTTRRLQPQIAHGLIDSFCVILAMTTAFYVTVTMVLRVAMIQISYCMAARAIIWHSQPYTITNTCNVHVANSHSLTD